ncbi:hypothetical protein DAY19_11665 [Halobacteriovorax vibrionivorans]|uniref:RHS repeat-associated core domain-containing protein n=1 Tax=Halobacteriovorax vibrionivorans TaxID=2152716 RepID=A0ABY0ICF4_9BACT|nr:MULTISPECIES: RHS repeat-associated core domain-containing protein [Halobacteriovorax]RZF20636.1 hypothetical protein DAY19_11665 [Halobacteriovorax vibrionivorans]TGD48953.1 hypothetical protein EP118_02065 [Halobacteriovorax sp. Y22]
MILDLKQPHLKCRNRYYNPGISRFMSEDPIGFNSSDYNNYKYVKNNPERFVDPEGSKYVSVTCSVLSAGLAGSSFVDAAELSSEYSLKVKQLTEIQEELELWRLKKRRSDKMCTDNALVDIRIKYLQKQSLKILKDLSSITREKAISNAIGVGFSIAAAACVLLPF